METKVKALQHVYPLMEIIDKRWDPVLFDEEISPMSGGLAAGSPAGFWTALS